MNKSKDKADKKMEVLRPDLIELCIAANALPSHRGRSAEAAPTLTLGSIL